MYPRIRFPDTDLRGSTLPWLSAAPLRATATVQNRRNNETTMNIKAFIQRHPVASFFALAYVIPWVGILVGVGPKFIRGEALGLMEAILAATPILPPASLIRSSR